MHAFAPLTAFDVIKIKRRCNTMTRYYSFHEYTKNFVGYYDFTYENFLKYVDYCVENGYSYFGMTAENSLYYSFQRMIKLLSENRYV
jgi:hypothetical protein